ncbi:MAG: hypothetical protein LBC72_02670 [Spirochaetaceae bacterium]|nr:hypothetical protein [Spirochaetaceae bacterium]
MLYPDAEQKALSRALAANKDAAALINVVFNNVKNNTLFFINMLNNSAGDAERNALTYTFYKANPNIAGIVIQNKDGSVQKIINIDLLNTNILDYSAFDYFLKTYQNDLAAAAALGGDVLNAEPVFEYPVLVYALGEAPQVSRGAYYYCFFLAADVLAAFSPANGTAEGADAGSGLLANRRGGLVLHTNAALSRAGGQAGDAAREAAADSRPSGAFVRLRGGEKQIVAFRKTDFGGIVLREYSARAAEAGVRGALTSAHLLLAAFLCITLFAARLLTRRLLSPLCRLEDAIRAAREGDFSFELSPGRADETGRLLSGFAALASSVKNLAAFTSMQIARAALHGELGDTIVKKNVVCGCVNIENLGDIKKRTSTLDLGVYISAFISIVNNCALKTNGAAEQFSGGAISCHWGCAHTTGSKNHDTLNAARAFLLMRVAFIDFNNEQKSKNKPPLRVSFALDCGVVSAGLAGGRLKKEYVVFGNTTKNAKNTALLNHLDIADIIISEKIYLRIRKYIIVCEADGFDPAKIKRFFALINLKTEEGVTQPIPRNRAELRKLLDIANESTRGTD